MRWRGEGNSRKVWFFCLPPLPISNSNSREFLFSLQAALKSCSLSIFPLEHWDFTPVFLELIYEEKLKTEITANNCLGRGLTLRLCFQCPPDASKSRRAAESDLLENLVHQVIGFLYFFYRFVTFHHFRKPVPGAYLTVSTFHFKQLQETVWSVGLQVKACRPQKQPPTDPFMTFHLGDYMWGFIRMWM